VVPFRGEAGEVDRLLSRPELIQQSIPIQKKICRLAAKYLDSEDREVRNLANAMYKHWTSCLRSWSKRAWSHHNFSERVLRLFVLIRKITYGNRSAKGEIALARLLTVTQTCKLQQRPLLAITDCGSMPTPAPASAQLRPLQNQQT